MGVFLAGISLQGAIILDVPNGALLSTDPTQTGRLSRNGLAQDWDGDEGFPGVINTTTVYHYQVFSINVGITPFIQIDIDSTSANTFFSAYTKSYLPDSAGSPNFGFDTNWLGDAGASGDPVPGDPAFFQVVAPINSTLLVVVNNTSPSNVGVRDPFHLTVEGFIDLEFDDPVAAPEPSALVLSGAGLFLLPLIARLRRRKARLP